MWKNPCDANAMCNSTGGLAYCTCRKGFIGNGSVCEGQLYFQNLTTNMKLLMVSKISMSVTIRRVATTIQDVQIWLVDSSAFVFTVSLEREMFVKVDLCLASSVEAKLFFCYFSYTGTCLCN